MFVTHNKVHDIVKYIEKSLADIYSLSEIKSITEIMFEDFIGWDKMTLRNNSELSLSESELLVFHQALKRLKKNEPIQYVVGLTEFFSLKFNVNNDVLIPRPETEELVDLIIKESKGNETILDIGTGSGCIPISIASKLKNATLYGLDISNDAIEMAKKNAELNEVKVDFLVKNVLEIISLNNVIKETLDIIVSNPPYITETEKQMMHSNVLEHEPHLALFVPDHEPLLFYNKIGKLAFEKLEEGGKLYFEINENYGEKTMELLKFIGFSDIRIIKDLQNKDRIVAAIR